MIRVSIVVHDKILHLAKMIDNLLAYPEVSMIVIRFNFPRSFYRNIPDFYPDKIKCFYNDKPEGFGKNHNLNFQTTVEKFFCVLNPDLVFLENPFSSLLKRFHTGNAGALTPTVLDTNQERTDHARPLMSLCSLVGLLILSATKRQRIFKDTKSSDVISIAGMFMLFPTSVFRALRGFDERYFLYYEDTDICRRMFDAKLEVYVDIESKVIHDAQRTSHKSFRFFLIHVLSLITYYLIHRDFTKVRRKNNFQKLVR